MTRPNSDKKPISRPAIVGQVSIATLDPVNANVLKSNSYWSEENTSSESIVREKWRKRVSCIGRLGVVDLDITADEKHVSNHNIGVHLGVECVFNIDSLGSKGILVDRRKPKFQKINQGNET